MGSKSRVVKVLCQLLFTPLLAELWTRTPGDILGVLCWLPVNAWRPVSALLCLHQNLLDFCAGSTAADGFVPPSPVLGHAEISKHQEGPLLKGVLEADSQQVHRNVFKCVTDARKQLVDLQQLVGVHCFCAVSHRVHSEVTAVTICVSKLLYWLFALFHSPSCAA